MTHYASRIAVISMLFSMLSFPVLAQTGAGAAAGTGSAPGAAVPGLAGTTPNTGMVPGNNMGTTGNISGNTNNTMPNNNMGNIAGSMNGNASTGNISTHCPPGSSGIDCTTSSTNGFTYGTSNNLR